MANKTRALLADVDAFLAGSAHPDDGRRLKMLMEEVSGERAVMWGPSIVGFGSYHYRYDSGHEGDMARIGFAPRARELVLYLAGGFPRHAELLASLGRHRTGKACLYIKRLADVDLAVLRDLIAGALAQMDESYPRQSGM